MGRKKKEVKKRAQHSVRVEIIVKYVNSTPKRQCPSIYVKEHEMNPVCSLVFYHSLFCHHVQQRRQQQQPRDRDHDDTFDTTKQGSPITFITYMCC